MAAADVFLLDDEEDEQRLPDHVMTADGQESELILIDNSQIKLTPTNQAGVYTLTVVSDKEGWAYGRVLDKVLSKMWVQTVSKNSKDMSAANFWQTDHSILADYSAVAEDLLHFADKVVAGTNTYTVTLTPKGDQVEIIETKFYAEDGTELADGVTLTQKMGKLIIAFTGEVQTFALTGYTLYVDGTPLSQYTPKTRQAEGLAANYWELDFSEFPPIKGEFRLVFTPKKVKFKNGTKGCKNTIEFTWTQNITPKSQVDIEVVEEGYGIVDRESGLYAHGELVITATPNFGYQFVKWMERDHDIMSEGPTLTYEVKEDVTLRAVFAPVELVLDGMVADTDNSNIWHPQYNGEPTDEQYVKYALFAFTTEYTPSVNYVPAATDLIVSLSDGTDRLYKQCSSDDYMPFILQADADRVYSSADVFAPLAKATYTVTIGSSGYATFCAPCPLTFDGISGMEAYTATVDGQQVVLTPATSVPAQTGVVLYGNPGSYVVRATEESANAQGELTGTVLRTVPDGSNNYVLSTGSNGDRVGFYRLPEGGAVQAHRAYLTLPSAAGAPLLGIVFDNATGIVDVRNSMSDGVDVWYTLDGRKLQGKPGNKGLYIVNGKKRLIK
jgi:hypothetical protein